MKKFDSARTENLPEPHRLTGPSHRTTVELKFRKGAGRHYATQYLLAPDTPVQLLRVSGLWASVQHGQAFGWLPTQCLEKLEAPRARAQVPVRPVSGQQDSRVAGAPSAPEVPDEDFVPTHRSTADLNLRKGSGTNYPVLRVLGANIQVRKLEEVGTWTKLSTGKDVGWVPSAYLARVTVRRPATGIQPMAPTEYTTTVRLNVRRDAGDRFPVLRIMQAGTLVRVNGKLGPWCRIMLDQDSGWVPASQLQLRYLASTTPVTTSDTTLYRGSSANYRVVAQLAAGEQVRVLASRGQWTKVQAGRLEGWVHSTHLG
ncbi:SH3 domain-containing protein [Paeniglutamicibacter gangotriensis]|uniref:SH3 domain-containing protein n=1 Tax=Paeniglutamicibacter gangotriensis TaxID=254787 RepID=A0A5B0E820_9MICC|nr:SH3 domain-containing protein [Paeniglutamicibacter gangotriensis]KAA0975217.1 SH3 domain-containing protein [Paeniglutamicibacter gangotriensis]